VSEVFAIEFSTNRRMPSGSRGDGDILGNRQYGLLLDMDVLDG